MKSGFLITQSIIGIQIRDGGSIIIGSRSGFFFSHHKTKLMCDRTPIEIIRLLACAYLGVCVCVYA